MLLKPFSFFKSRLRVLRIARRTPRPQSPCVRPSFSRTLNLVACLAVVLTTSLLGCGEDTPPTPAARTVTDALGRTIEVPDTVQRVVTLAPNITEIVFAAGAEDRLVGVTTADDFPPAVASLPHVGVLPVDFEAIAALEPDLVLANENINNPRDAETFAALDIPVYFFSFSNLGNVMESIRTTGQLLHTEAHAEATADSLAAALRALRARTDTLHNRPLTLFLISDDVPYSFGPESYVHELIEVAGGRSATAEIETPRPVLSDEFVLTREPEVIIGPFAPDYEPAHLLEHHPTWDIVPALRDGRVYSVPPNIFLRPTPRLVLAAQHLAHLLHPTLFDDPLRVDAGSTQAPVLSE